MGGASRGWRPLAAGAALCLSPSLPPARRRSEAELPASPSWSRSWWCALAATASLHRETPRGPSRGSQRPGGGSPGAGGVVETLAPRRWTETDLDPPPPG